MREVQLYVKPEGSSEYLKLDLFDDEVISLTQTIRNAQDVSKVFTDFSRSFTVPASKTNNAIFRHYYNSNIDDGFDARKRVDARIEINRVPFKYGRLRLDGVQLKTNKAYAYKLTFFGNTIKLRDSMGEDKLGALGDLLDQYNTTYDAASIKAGLSANPATSDVIVPLITHSQRLTYGTGAEANGGDLKYDAAVNHGVLWSELKYAIRVDTIVQAIADRYGFTFSNDSFFNSGNANYYNLFLWLHRKKGDVQSNIVETPLLSLIDGFNGNTDPNRFAWRNTAGTQIFLDAPRYLVTFSLRIQNPSGISYSVSVKRDGEERMLRQNVTNTDLTLNLLGEARDGSAYEVYASAATSGSLTFTWKVDIQEPFNAIETEMFSATETVSLDSSFNIVDQTPEIKVIDFLSGLFKMFNLVALVDEQNVVTVKTLDRFYSEGTFRDISQYVDNSTSDVDVAIPYAEIEYKYKSSSTILAEQYSNLRNKDWGADSYNTEDNLKEGEKFTIEIPFEHMQFERLTDVGANTITKIMYGYYVDDNQSPYIGAPLIFYPVLEPLNGNDISFVTAKDADGNFTARDQITGSINIPSNSLSLTGDNEQTDNIHFFLEGNEYTPGVEFYKTLFYNYHYNYIASLFNFRNRLVRINALLPVSILANYSLADTFVVKGDRFKINSINTNLNTGESSIELIRLIPAYVLDGAGSAGGSTGSGGGGELPVTVFATISGNQTVNEGTTQLYTATVTGTATGLTQYSWSVSNGGTITAGANSQTVQILWGEVSVDSIRTVTLTVTRNNDGDPKTFTTAPYQVTVLDSETPPAPTPMSVDIEMSGGTPDSSVSEGAQRIYDAVLFGDYTTPVTYNWTIDGGTITGGQGTSRVFVTWNTVEADYTGNIAVSVSTADSQTDSANYDVTIINGTAAPYIDIQITGINPEVQIGTSQTYGSVIDSNITTSNPDIYSWSITGGVINSGQFSSSVNVTWDTEGVGQISVSVVREGQSDTDTENVTVINLQTIAEITGVTSPVVEGDVASYGSVISGNTTGTITYFWSVSKGEIAGGTYDGSGNSVISGTTVSGISVTWGTIEIGTGSVSLTAVRGGIDGNDSQTVEVLGTYYVFEACDGGQTVVDRQGDPPASNQRFANYAVNPVEYYTHNGQSVNSPAGFTIVELQPVFEGGSITFGCPTPAPPPPSTLTITGDTTIDAGGQTSSYTLEVEPNTVQWQLSHTNLTGYNPIPLTITTSTSGTGDGSFTVSFGAYNGNGTETLRSVITATELNPAFGNTASSGSIVLSQSPPPSATLNVYARANLVPANRTFSYSTGGSYFTIANANIGTGCGYIGQITNLAVGATVTIVTSPTNELLGNDSSSCPGDFTGPSGATSYSITVAQGINNVALNVDTVAGTYALTIGRSLVDGPTACSRYSSAPGTTYADAPSIFGANTLFGDANGYSYATAGWYSDGSDYKYWDGTDFVGGATSCPGGGNEP